METSDTREGTVVVVDNRGGTRLIGPDAALPSFKLHLFEQQALFLVQSIEFLGFFLWARGAFTRASMNVHSASTQLDTGLTELWTIGKVECRAFTDPRRRHTIPSCSVTKKRAAYISVFILAALVAAWIFIGTHHCPASGLAPTAGRRAFHRLKNRIALPTSTDFDTRVTLETLLQPGHDEARWSTSRAANIEGYVVSVGEAGVELANCYVRRDVHINVARAMTAPVTEQLVLEVTPPMQDWARAQGHDWSAAKLEALVGRWCSFEGWLFFDYTHAGESENISPGRKGNWRASAWEIHPITNFHVIR